MPEQLFCRRLIFPSGLSQATSDPSMGRCPLVLPRVSSSALRLRVQILSTPGRFPSQQLGIPSASALPWMFIGLAPSHRSCFRLNACLCTAASEHPVHSSPFHPHISAFFQTPCFICCITFSMGLPRWLSGKESASQRRRHRFNPCVGKIPREENSNSLQYSCLENSKNRGAGQATVHGITKGHD